MLLCLVWTIEPPSSVWSGLSDPALVPPIHGGVTVSSQSHLTMSLPCYSPTGHTVGKWEPGARGLHFDL